MGLVGHEVAQTWGSHQPVLKAILEVVHPQSVLECGSGEYSTPLLAAASPYLITVEHDQVWARRMLQKCPGGPAHRWVIQSFLGTKNHTSVDELPPGVKGLIRRFYRSLAEGLSPVDVLFVDTYRSCRVIAIKALTPLARIVVIHDVEPQSEDYYHWEALDDLFPGWNLLFHRPDWTIRKRFWIPWTVVLSRDPLPKDEMDEVMARESLLLWGRETCLEEFSC